MTSVRRAFVGGRRVERPPRRNWSRLRTRAVRCSKGRCRISATISSFFCWRRTPPLWSRKDPTLRYPTNNGCDIVDHPCGSRRPCPVNWADCFMGNPDQLRRGVRRRVTGGQLRTQNDMCNFLDLSIRKSHLPECSVACGGPLSSMVGSRIRPARAAQGSMSGATINVHAKRADGLDGFN